MINNEDNNFKESSTVFSSSSVDNKKHKLSPTVKGLIAAGVFIIVAVAVFITVKYAIPSGDNDESSSSETSSVSIPVLSLDVSDISSFSVKNQAGSYTALSAGTATDSTGNQVITWKIKDYEKYSMPSLSYFADTFVNLQAAKIYSKGSDDSVYGFDSPTCTINILMSDKSQKLITIGAASPDNLGYYAAVDGDDNIYLVIDPDFTNYMLRDFKNFISLNTISPNTNISADDGYYDENGNLVAIDYLILGGTCRKHELRIESPPPELDAIDFLVTEPSYRACRREDIATMLSFATGGLTNNGAYVLGYTDKDLADYGLDNPRSTFKCKIGDYSFDVAFGNIDDDGYYSCIVKGSDIIYKISAEYYPFIENDDEDIYVDSVFSAFIADIDTVSVTTADDNIKFTLDRSGNTEDEADTIFDVYANGTQQIDTDSFCFWYQRLLLFTAEDYVDSGHKDEKLFMTVKITYNNGKSNDTIKLYEYSGRRYLFTLNDLGDCLIASSNVTDFYESMYKMLAGIEVLRP